MAEVLNPFYSRQDILGRLARAMFANLEQDPYSVAPGPGAIGPVGQVRNLERVLRSLRALGYPAERLPSAVGSVHPERYAVEFLTPPLRPFGPHPIDAGRVIATSDPRYLTLIRGIVGQAPEVVHDVPSRVLRRLRISAPLKR